MMYSDYTGTYVWYDRNHLVRSYRARAYHVRSEARRHCGYIENAGILFVFGFSITCFLLRYKLSPLWLRQLEFTVNQPFVFDRYYLRTLGDRRQTTTDWRAIQPEPDRCRPKMPERVAYARGRGRSSKRAKKSRWRETQTVQHKYDTPISIHFLIRYVYDTLPPFYHFWIYTRPYIQNALSHILLCSWYIDVNNVFQQCFSLQNIKRIQIRRTCSLTDVSSFSYPVFRKCFV